MPLQDYAWTILNTSSPWRTTFISSGAFSRHLVRFSVSGIPDADDLRIELDGRDLGWMPEPNIGLDRWHYDVYINESLGKGAHDVVFILQREREAAQLCNIEILEFGSSEQ